ncbi:hypothetical protein [Paraoerskovia marina]|uniref:Uncharacterized protein n=1 Tax=Paraoerskovia marina TaxID=545619 RepID=A0A1H1P685_9CELL|nr:hypothetical protein [Paraoerskovia marina]SDS06693.1 hypothetical protein SAMN04489860_0721 [Paraoerskovia marina]
MAAASVHNKKRGYLGWWIFIGVVCLALMTFGMMLGAKAGDTTNDEIFTNPLSIFSESAGQSGEPVE